MDMDRKSLQSKGLVKLSDDLSISAIIELGQLYKKLYTGKWIYGDLEHFVEDNLYNFMAHWDWEVDVDTDLAVEHWWKHRGKYLEVNKKDLTAQDWCEILGEKVTRKDAILLNNVMIDSKVFGSDDYFHSLCGNNYKVFKNIQEYANYYYSERQEIDMLMDKLIDLFEESPRKEVSIKDILLEENHVFLEEGQIVMYF